MCMYMCVPVYGAYRMCVHVVFACTCAGVCGVYRVCVCAHEYIVCACMCMSRACVCVVCNGGEEEVRLAHQSLFILLQTSFLPFTMEVGLSLSDSAHCGAAGAHVCAHPSVRGHVCLPVGTYCTDPHLPSAWTSHNPQSANTPSLLKRIKQPAQGPPVT